MDQTTKRIIGIVLTTLIVILVGFYAYWQSKDYIEGSRITFLEPKDGSSVQTEAVIIEGNAKNIAYISLNDSPIFVDSKGDFREKILLLDGYNIISVKAQDRFGKKTEKNISVVYNKKNSEENTATSSPTIKIN